MRLGMGQVLDENDLDWWDLISVEFNPPLVHDGEETVLAISAQDDISGVRTISGNVVSPSGALQGFALQREGETNRFVARLTIPKSAAATSMRARP